MARNKIDVSTLTAREQELRAELKKLRLKRREIERAELSARGERIVALAEKFGILWLPDTIFAAIFKKLAAENPPTSESPESGDTDESEVRTQTPESATEQAAAGSSPETAQQIGQDSRKRWFGGGA